MRRPSPYRMLISAFLVLHLGTSLAFVARKTPPGKAVRGYTVAWEQLIGFNQNWAMFVPPPHHDVWPAAYGAAATGERRELRLLWANRHGDQQRGAYDMELLLDRNLLPDGNHSLRRSYGEWLCRREAEAGSPVIRVELYNVRQRSLSMKQRRRGVEPNKPEAKRMLTVRCP